MHWFQPNNSAFLALETRCWNFNRSGENRASTAVCLHLSDIRHMICAVLGAVRAQGQERLAQHIYSTAHSMVDSLVSTHSFVIRRPSKAGYAEELTIPDIYVGVVPTSFEIRRSSGRVRRARQAVTDLRPLLRSMPFTRIANWRLCLALLAFCGSLSFIIRCIGLQTFMSDFFAVMNAYNPLDPTSQTREYD